MISYEYYFSVPKSALQLQPSGVWPAAQQQEPSQQGRQVREKTRLARAAPGGRMASKLSAPNMPRLEIVNVPLLYSSGASCLPRARFTRSA